MLENVVIRSDARGTSEKEIFSTYINRSTFTFT